MTDEEAKAFAVDCVSRLTPKPAVITPADPQEVELHQGFMKGGLLDKVPKLEVLGMPLGDGIKGAAILGVSDVIAGFKDVVDKDGKLPSWAIPIGVAFVLNIKFVKDLLGPGAVDFGKRLLAVEAIQGAVDIRGKVRDLLGGLLPKGGEEAGRRPPNIVPPGRQPAGRIPPALGPGVLSPGPAGTRSMGTGDRYARAF